jgi:hypothetical protein
MRGVNWGRAQPGWLLVPPLLMTTDNPVAKMSPVCDAMQTSRDSCMVCNFVGHSIAAWLSKTPKVFWTSDVYVGINSHHHQMPWCCHISTVHG